MKAVVAHEYGGPEILHLEDVSLPIPKDDQILVRVIASGVNPADPLILGGKYAREFGTNLPLVLGYDMAGVVVKTGAKISRFKPGDEVYAYLLFGGGWQEYCLTNEGEVALKPAGMTFEEAAAVPLAALTAWQALVDEAQVAPGQTGLVHGGSGGVGEFAVQIAKARGARVIATASTKNQDLLKRFGADISVDYTKIKFEDVARDVDCVIDPVGGETLARSYSVVKKGGIVITLVSRCNAAELAKHQIRGKSLASHPDSRELAEITRLIAAKKLKPFVSEVLPLTDAAEAVAKAGTHHTRGKMVLRIAPEPATANN